MYLSVFFGKLSRRMVDFYSFSIAFFRNFCNVRLIIIINTNKTNPTVNNTCLCTPSAYPISLTSCVVKNLTELNGNGIFTWPNGERYNGGWKDDQRCGQGEMIYINGDIYQGDWKEDKRNGKGMITHPNGKKEKGEWKNDVQHPCMIF